MVSENKVSSLLESATRFESKAMHGRKYVMDVLDKDFRKISETVVELVNVYYDRFDDTKYYIVKDLISGEVKTMNQFYIRLRDFE